MLGARAEGLGPRPQPAPGETNVTNDEGDDVIEISISRDLAAEHPQFMAACAQRRLRLEVFDVADARREPQVVGASAGTGLKSPAAGRRPVAADRASA